MRSGERGTGSSHDDVLLARLYQQVTELRERRFAAGYDLAAGLDQYRAWLAKHSEEPAQQDAPEASARAVPAAVGMAGPAAEREAHGALPASVTQALVTASGAFQAPLTGGMEWSADLAVIELYSMHYRALVRLAAMLVRDTPTAEEVVQDSFVAMHGGWQRLKDTDKALAYLRQAVVNRSRSVLRHRLVVEKNLQKAPPDMPSAEHGAFVLLERSAVIAALRDLPERQREAIVLRYYADLSEAEIAATMGISRGAVKSHTSRGMAALRAALEQV
jgi:RNA polymerase sigma-70 factor (sigma-E family)